MKKYVLLVSDEPGALRRGASFQRWDIILETPWLDEAVSYMMGHWQDSQNNSEYQIQLKENTGCLLVVGKFEFHLKKEE